MYATEDREAGSRACRWRGRCVIDQRQPVGCPLAAAILAVRWAAARPLTCFDPKSHRSRHVTATDDDKTPVGQRLQSFWQLTYLAIRAEQSWVSNKKPIIYVLQPYHPSILGHINRVSAKKCAGTRIVGVCRCVRARARVQASIIHNRGGGCHVRGLVAYREGVRDLCACVRDRTRER